MPESLSHLLAWCMAKEPEERPSIEQLRELLDAIEADPNVPTLVRDVRRELGFQPPWTLLMILAGVLIVGVAALICWLLLNR